MISHKPEKLKLTKRIFLFVLTLALTNCQDSENLTTQEQSNIKTVSINDAKAFLTKLTNSHSAKSASTEIDNLEFDKATQEKINGSDQLLTVIPFATNNEVRNDRVLIVKIDNEIRSVILSMQPDENSTQDRFSGKVFIYSLEGDFITGYGAKDGIYIGQYLKEKSNSKTSKNPQDGEGGVLIIYYYKKPVNAVNATDFDAIWGSGGSSIGYAPVGGASGVSWDATGGGGSGSGITAPPMAQIIDELKGKEKCLNDLLNKNGNSFVQKLLAKFEGDSKFDIKIVSKEKVTSADKDGVLHEINGKTIPPVGKLIGIEISTSRAEINPSLEVARVILHEYIHADIFRKLGTKTPVTDKEGLDFKKTYEAYGEQHSTIAILYLNSMKEALKEFHKTVLVDDYNKYTTHFGEVPSDAFYEALAWGGLQDANVKAWTDLPADKKAAIKALATRVPMLSKTVPCSN